LAWAASAAGALIGHDPEPAVRIPLVRMGFQALSSEFLLAGSSMLTVDFVDNDHLLITFGVRRLMKREPNQPADQEDRMIGAFLVELPSGRVLAQTEWRLHDRAQYLWNLGHGRFLLRVGDQLTMFAPLASADANEAFREVPLLKIDRHIVVVLVSSDSDLLTVETTKWGMGSGEPGAGFSADPAPVQINFYRLLNLGPTVDDFRLAAAGTIRTKTAIALPMTAVGRLDVLEGGKDRWLFNLNEHAGKVDELSSFDTSCFPRPMFVGHSEFVAFGCRGAPDKIDFAGFSMKGEEMWQQNFYETYVNPTFAFAPEAGRFALGRTIVSGDVDPQAPLPASQVTAEEVRVYQTHDGRQLFRIECSPIERAGQNFALSPDGQRLVVVRETMVKHPGTKDTPAYTQNEASAEVYALPELTAEDQAAVKEAKTLAPADTGARIDMALERASESESGSETPKRKTVSSATVDLGDAVAASSAGAGGGTLPQGSPAAAVTEPSGDAESGTDLGTATQGDQQPAAPRKPPTLYGPGENPQKPK
jgi:hypothetical protein